MVELESTWSTCMRACDFCGTGTCEGPELGGWLVKFVGLTGTFWPWANGKIALREKKTVSPPGQGWSENSER